MSKKLTEDQKLRRLIKRNIESRENFLNKVGREHYREIISIFLERFILCEVGMKKALAAYYKSKGEERSIEDINMPITDIRNALGYAGLEVEVDIINKMFKKNTIRGEKSVRDLRNAIAHELSVNDIQELVDRWTEIDSLLADFQNILVSEPLE